MSNNDVHFIQGNEACALGAIHAGARFFAGYPISPATEITEFCSREMPGCGGIFLQMEDEIASIAAVIGASLGGLKGFTATSGPGLSLMQENLGFAIMAEVPCVIVNVQRFGPSTGVATRPAQADIMAVRWGTHGDHTIIVLTPSTVQECYDLTLEAFNLAERFRSPVIVLTDATLGHLREKVTTNLTERNIINRIKPTVPPEDYKPYAPDERGIPAMSSFGDTHISRVTGLVHDERGYSSAKPEIARKLVKRLINKIDDYQDELPRPLYFGPGNADMIVVSFGISARACRQAALEANNQGLKVGFIQLKTLWPFPETHLRALTASTGKVLVVELSDGQLLREVKACGLKARIFGLGIIDTEVITPTRVMQAIGEVNGSNV